MLSWLIRYYNKSPCYFVIRSSLWRMQTQLSLWPSWDFSAQSLVPFRCILHMFIRLICVYSQGSSPWLVYRCIFERGELRAIDWSAESVSFLLSPFLFLFLSSVLTLMVSTLSGFSFSSIRSLDVSLLLITPGFTQGMKWNWKQNRLYSLLTCSSGSEH